METPRFVLIPCQTCKATSVALADRRRPVMCARCRAPYDADSASFRRVTDPRSEAAAPIPRLTDRPPAIV